MFRKMLCKQLIIMIVSVLLGGGLVAEALPVSSVGDDGTSPSLVIVCGTPAEFAVVGNGVKASGQPVSPSLVDGQAGGDSLAGPGAVPEPSSLVLLILGVLGMLGLTRVRKHWRRGLKVLLLVVLGGCLVSSVAFAKEIVKNATFLYQDQQGFKYYQTADGRTFAGLEHVGTLTNAPDYKWWYGCTPTSAGMMMGYYDINGYGGSTYPNLVPGGTAELTNYGNPSALANQVIASSGHIADFWTGYGNSGDDPCPAGCHTFDSLADFMGTSRDACNSSDGSTWFYYWTDGSPWTPADDVTYGLQGCTGTHGLKTYIEYRGYTYTSLYHQLIYGYSGNTLGFTWNQFKAEIDAGRPVLINVVGHSMFAYGYSGTNTMYIHDTWTAGTHTMTWGGSYSGMTHYAVMPLTLGSGTLDCTNAVSLGSGVPYNGTTVGAPSNVSSYNCSSWDESGPEMVHKITTTATGTITATLSNLSADLDVFILNACSSSNCVGYGDDTATYSNAPPGIYYIVVDGYSGASGSYTLTVTAPTPPPAATLVSPSGTICTTTPTYTWNRVSSATWYRLYVNGPSGNVIDQWYNSSASVCGPITCSVTPAKTLVTGSHTWRIQTYNSYGYGPWSAWKSFTVNPGALPGAVTLISPSGRICTNPPPYYWWYQDPCATWYYLWVQGPSGTPVIQKWYSKAQAHCNGTWCWVTDNTADLASGTHTWWIQTWNSAGYGPWSGGMSFTPLSTTGFNSQFNGSMTGWSAVAGSWSIASSAYLTTTGVSSKWASVSYNGNYKNLDYQVKLWRNGCTGCSNALIIRGTPSPLGTDKEWNNAYYFQYTRNGSYAIWKNVNGSWSWIQSWTSSSAINQGGAWNTLRVWANGSDLWFAINDTWVWNGTDTSLSCGQVGITMYSDGTSGDQLWADWATLSVLSGPASIAGAEAQLQISAEQQALNVAANQHPVGSPEKSPGFVLLQKSGSGSGTITLGGQVCGPECSVLVVPYIEGTRLMPQVTPAADSRFVGWQTADGQAIEGTIFYAQPGDTVIAIFEK